MEPWHKVVDLRKEVREGRSFNPDEFAIHLEQVVAKTAPEDYRDPVKFFARTCFTQALNEHAGLVLRRVAGKTENTAPVLTLITQFGGGKTHILTCLYHLANGGKKADTYPGVSGLLEQARLPGVPEAKVAVFVGNAWDPQDGRETPWIDLARQLAGDEGVAALGNAAMTTPPGTEALVRVFGLAGKPVLLLFDEVLNFMNRHRKMAESFHAFIQNLTVSVTGTTRGAAVISLPRSQVEMTEWDMQWQDRISKVVRRVAKDLIANDETEIGEVVRRRLFEDLGSARTRRNVAKAYADWCFERRAELPPEWTAVDTTSSEAKAKDFLRTRFESCYPFHPATLSVFQRKWQALSQYQQTRGTLAMLAQWISWAYRDGFNKARTEPLITLGSAPLGLMEFRSTVLGQLGEARLIAAIDADIAGEQAHARALDADTKGPLRDIHRRVASAVLFESSGGQTDKVAHLPELRFALGEPGIDTTSIDNAAMALEAKAYFIRKVGSDGYRIHHKPTLKKVVNDRRASLDDPGEVRPSMRKLVDKEFRSGATVPVEIWPEGPDAIADSPKLTLVVLNADTEWTGDAALRRQLAEWTKRRGKSDRLYPGALVWCLKKPGRDFRDKVETMLAWRRVAKEVRDGTLGAEFEQSELKDVQTEVKVAEGEAEDEVWADYTFVALADSDEPEGIRVINLGEGHSSGPETLCGRVIAALKSNSLLNESIGIGYLERNWPPALKSSGTWPLKGLRQSFPNGTLTRLLDPDQVLRSKVVDFVARGECGLASGQRPDGTYERVWYDELLPADEVAFDPGVFVLTKQQAKALKAAPTPSAEPEGGEPEPEPGPEPEPQPRTDTTTDAEPEPAPATKPIRLVGTIPPELWNRLGTKLIPKLRAGSDLEVGVTFSATFDAATAASIEAELRQVLQDLGLENAVSIESPSES